MWLKYSFLLLFIIFNVATSRHLDFKEHPNKLPAHDLMDDPYTLDGEDQAKKEGYDLKEIFEEQLQSVLDQVQQLGKAVSSSNETKNKQVSKLDLMDDPYVLDGRNVNDGYDLKNRDVDKNNDHDGYCNEDKILVKKFGDHGIMDESPPSDDMYKARGRFERGIQTTTEIKLDEGTTAAIIIMAILLYVLLPLSICFCCIVLPIIVIVYACRRDRRAAPPPVVYEQ